TSSSTDDFWDDAPASRTTQSGQTSKSTQSNQKEKMSFEEQVAYTKKISEERNQQAKEKLDNYFDTERTRLQNEQENKLNVLAQSYYANEARSRAEQGISDNSSFNRKYDNVDDLQNAFYQQTQAINQN